MGARRKKVKRFVIDVNSYITIFINRETDWLLGYIERNGIEVFIDYHLITELKKVLDYPKIKKFLPLGAEMYISFVYTISTYVKAAPHYIESPDPEDNYLYDIALSTNAKLLVTGEKALLCWVDSPVDSISLSEFKKLF